jgi:hypothetical protein
MKRYIHKIFIAITVITVTFLAACEDVVQVDLPEEYADLISVEAYLTTDSTDNIYVRVEKTLPVDRTESNPAVSHATVEILDNSANPNTVLLQEQGKTGVYRLPANKVYPAQTGRTYTLKITTPDGTVITGSEKLKAVENLDKTRINLSGRGNYEFLAIFINAQETSGLGDYYKWDIFINNQLMNESQYLSIASDELVDGNYIYDFEIFTDFATSEDEKMLHKGDTVRVEQLSISKSVYDFYLGMINQTFSGSPFSVPPANVPGNLTSSDGKRVLGIFSARDKSKGTEIIIDDNNYTPLASSVPR